MEEIAISVIVPIHNVSDYLKKCLNSILNQTFNGNYEVLLMLDNATDEDRKVAIEFKNKSDIFEIHEVNFRDLGFVRNRGLELAKGKYIYFVDGDDYILKDSLYKFYQRAEDTESDIVIGNYYLEKNKKITRAFIKIKDKWSCKNNLIWANKIVTDIRFRGYAWNKFYRKDFLINHNIRFIKTTNFVEDLAFNYLAFLKANKIVCDSNYHYVYVFRQSSILHHEPIKFVKKYLRTLSLLRYYSKLKHIEKSTNIIFFFKKIMLWVHGLQNRKALSMNLFSYLKRVNFEVNSIRKFSLDSFTHEEFFIEGLETYKKVK